MPGPSTNIKIRASYEDITEMRKILRGWTRAYALVRRVMIILLLFMGLSVSEVSRQTKANRRIIRKWAERYNNEGLKGLNDSTRKGRPPVFNAEIAMHIVKIACEMPELRGRSLDKWDCEEIAEELIRTKVVTSISNESIRRILNSQKIKPWRHHMWLSEKTPRDQEFCTRVKEVMNLYFREMKPCECVLSIDENTSIQARKRIAEIKAAGPGRAVLCEHEYKRKGALNLIAAFDTRTGIVYGKCYGRKRQVEFINFLEHLDSEIPRDKKTIHIVCDNVPMHKGKQVQEWLKKNPRFIFHFTPVHCSWMNQVEQWFGILKRKRLTISNFESKDDLRDKLYLFISQWNENAHSFKWNDKTRMKLEKMIEKIEMRLNSNNNVAA